MDSSLRHRYYSLARAFDPHVHLHLFLDSNKAIAVCVSSRKVAVASGRSVMLVKVCRKVQNDVHVEAEPVNASTDTDTTSQIRRLEAWRLRADTAPIERRGFK